MSNKSKNYVDEYLNVKDANDTLISIVLNEKAGKYIENDLRLRKTHTLSPEFHYLDAKKSNKQKEFLQKTEKLELEKLELEKLEKLEFERLEKLEKEEFKKRTRPNNFYISHL